MSIRLVLADDHAVLREGLRVLLSGQPGIEVVGEASDGRSAVRVAKEMSPDVVLMDISMDEMSGIDAARAIRQDCPSVRVLALSVHADEPFVSSMLEAGACGYIVKGASFREVVDAVQIVMKGQVYLSPAVAGTLVNKAFHLQAAAQPDGARPLSPREREILSLLAAGKSTKQVAHETGISVRTVETHRHHIMEKLGIDNLAGLTKYAIRTGLANLKK